jgi:site-specific DNA-methyltransferase (adenine-specific)
VINLCECDSRMGLIKPYYEDKESGITLYCGDCREILAELDAGSVDLIFTDPPYGHNNNNNGDMASRWEAIFDGKKDAYVPEKDWRPIANDGIEANDLIQWFFPQAMRLLAPGCCCCCCCGGGGPDPQFARWSLWLDTAFNGGFKQMVVWDKGPMGMGHHYRRSYETVLVAQKPGAACKWYDETKRVENIIRPGDYGIAKIIPQADEHPTVKPVALGQHFIQLHSKEGDLILDPFAGSGSTLVGAKQSGRRAIGIEISEKYCQIAVNRLRQMELFTKGEK